MTGRVKSFCPRNGTGVITTEDGRVAHFEIGDVLAFDRAGLKPKAVVSFAASGTMSLRATEIVVRTGCAEEPASARPRECGDLRYAGFSPQGNLRVYLFEERIAGGVTRKFSVEADPALLLQRHVSLQDTPALCLRILLAKLSNAAIPANLPEFRCLLSESDLAAFLLRTELLKPRTIVRNRRGVRGPSPVFSAAPPPRPEGSPQPAPIHGAAFQGLRLGPAKSQPPSAH